MALSVTGIQNTKLNVQDELRLANNALQLQLGQMLKTVVVKAMENNQVLLNLQGQQVLAKTNQQLRAGDSLNVKVKQVEGEIILQVLQNDAPPLPINNLKQAFVHYLPKQMPASQLLASLIQLKNSSLLPISVKQSIQQLLASLPSLAKLPNELKRVVQQSGYFLESTLLANSSSASSHTRAKNALDMQSDFKALCLRLLESLAAENSGKLTSQSTLSAASLQHEPILLPGAVPQPIAKHSLPNFNSDKEALALLYSQTEQTLARINAGQLSYLLNPESNTFTLLIDLVVQTANRPDVIPIKIEEARSRSAAQSSWSMTFAVSLKNLGGLQAKVTLNGSKINVLFHVDKNETIDLITNNAANFAEVLAQTGLRLGNWHVRHGLEENQIDAHTLHLLDLKI